MFLSTIYDKYYQFNCGRHFKYSMTFVRIKIFNFYFGFEVSKGEKNSKLDILKDQSDGCLCRIWKSMILKA